MSAPLIGISTYGRDQEQSFSLPAQYVDCVRRAGGRAVLLAVQWHPELNAESDPRQQALFDAFIRAITSGKEP